MNLNPNVEIVIVNPGHEPVNGSELAGAYDLRLVVPEGMVELAPGEVRKFSAGFKLNIAQRGIGFFIIPRSGTGSKGLHVANVVGLIDADYQGEVIVALRNVSTEVKTIVDKERYAQGYFAPVLHPVFKQVESFSEATARGDGGFGSTGTK